MTTKTPALAVATKAVGEATKTTMAETKEAMATATKVDMETAIKALEAIKEALAIKVDTETVIKALEETKAVSVVAIRDTSRKPNPHHLTFEMKSEQKSLLFALFAFKSVFLM